MNATAVVESWRDIELFSPQTIARVTDSSVNGARVRDLTRPDELDWLDLPTPPGKMWQHQLYFGPFAISDIFSELDKLFEHTEDSFDERPRGDSALAAVLVDGAGHVVAGSAVLSSCAWGLGRARRQVMPRASDFDQAADDFVTALTLYCEDEARRRGTERLSIDAASLMAIHHLVQQHSGLGEGSLGSGVRVKSLLVKEQDSEDEIDSSDYLNSFHLADLSLVAREVRRGNGGAALAQLLAGPTTSPTVDLRRLSWGATLANVGATNLTRGRWPSPTDQPMALSQQLAVNLALGTTSLPQQPVTAVNGPPGTGKTTLLRDVLAELVVRRAEAIATLRRPDDAYGGKLYQWKKQDGYSCTVRALTPALTGFEMVVASNNNLAVQNLSDNLPLLENVKGLPGLRHLPGIARSIQLAHAGRGADPGATPPPWGLVTGRLGSARNRSEFRSGLWFGKADPIDPVSTGDVANLQDWLKGWLEIPPATPWSACVQRYRRAADRVDRLLAEARAAEDRLRQLDPLRRRVTVLEEETARSGHELALARQAYELAVQATHQATAQLAEATDQRESHLRFRPGFLEWLSTFGRASREWSRRDVLLADDIARCSEEVARSSEQEDRARAALESQQETTARFQASLAELRARLAGMQKAMHDDAQQWGKAYPDASWWADEFTRETTAPWQTVELNGARNDLFAAALELHRDLMAHTASTTLSNLRAVVEVVRRPPSQLDVATTTAAWQCLFLAVPLVTTTFASAGRTLAGLGAGSLGWLLIDEAGQATPGSAVGSLWRCARAIVVGDPLQLEPITTLPHEAERAILEHHGAPEWAAPTRISVQQLADQAMPHGTSLARDDHAIWVGAPLVVHRRCDEPMFSISNTIAYDGMMVQATRSPECALEPSRWIDVPSASGSGHAIGAQVQQAVTEVEALLVAGVDPGQIIVIAPFKDMSQALKRTMRRISTEITAGTVHTAQGREADVVLLVLGGDKARPGARQWAAQSPNLLNVAASRAKRRLLVIGDHRDWASLPHFREMAERLPRVDGPDRSASSRSARF